MIKKIGIVILILLVVILIINRVEFKKQNKSNAEDIAFQVDLSGIESETYFNPSRIKAALKKYLQDHQLNCKNAVALNYRYEDLDSAEQAIDIFFELDDKNKTLVTVVYHPQLQGGGVDVKAVDCEYTHNDIITESWYKEEIQ